MKKEEEPKKQVKGRVKPYIDARGKTYDEVNKKSGKPGAKKNSTAGRGKLARGSTVSIPGGPRGSTSNRP